MRSSLTAVLYIALPCVGAGLRYDGSSMSIFGGIIGGLFWGFSLSIPISCMLGEFIFGAKLTRRILMGWCLGALVHGIYLIASGQLLSASTVRIFGDITITLFCAFIVAGLVLIYHRGV